MFVGEFEKISGFLEKEKVIEQLCTRKKILSFSTTRNSNKHFILEYRGIVKIKIN